MFLGDGGRGLRAGVLDVFQKGLFWGVVAGRLRVLSSVILRFDESVLMGSVVYVGQLVS
jgi:hypothetical protein